MSNVGPVFDWNELGTQPRLLRAGSTLLDETLRDGIQNPSVRDPPIAQKFELLQVMNELGVHVVNAGLPAASDRSRADTEAICREISRSKLAIRPAAAARTLVSDIVPIVEIAQRVSLPLELYTFVGSSPVRQMVEDWDVGELERLVLAAVEFAVREGLSVCLVTEDTTRSRPEALRCLWRAAIDRGAARVCIADTVGHATPDGIRSLVRFCRHVLEEAGAPEVGVDWHGHDDRGFALDNALRALEAGADRVHATALGIGERCGNTAMELLLLNLAELGELEDLDRRRLKRYCELAAEATGFVVPALHPLFSEPDGRAAELKSGPPSGRSAAPRPLERSARLETG